MIPHKMNGRLLFLALIGIILYFTANLISSLDKSTAMEDEVGAPAVSKAKAEETAKTFLSEKFGFSADELFVAYENDPYISGYLIKNNLKNTYDTAYEEKAPLDYWTVTAKKTGSNEQYSVEIGLEHPGVTAWKKNAPLPAAHDEKGAAAARKALSDAGYNPDQWTYEPNKRDGGNRFVFTSKTERIGEATMLIEIGVKNGEAVSFKPSFGVPESYMHYIRSQEKSADWMTVGSLVLTVAFGITALVYAIKYGKEISFVRGIFLSATVFVLYVISNMNMADGLMATSGEPGSDAVMKAVLGVFVVVAGALTGVAVWLCLIAGDQQWRRKGWNPWPRWRDRDFGEETFYGMGRAYLICLFILGIQQMLFLVAGNVFGAFGVNDPSQSVFNMKWPGLFPVLAWVAAIMEEAVYRQFGIVLFLKILRIRFLSVLVPGFIWALGHTGYTIYPSYTRLFEVTVLGIVFGYTFLRYGLITAILTHAVMDSLLMGLSLMMEDPTAAHIALGLFYIALPAVIGYVIRFLHPRFRPKPRRPAYDPRTEPRLES